MQNSIMLTTAGLANNLRYSFHRVSRQFTRNKFFFSIPNWYKVPNEIISAKNVNQFKNIYDKHFDLLNKKEITT
jgi:hypothetical protein